MKTLRFILLAALILSCAASRVSAQGTIAYYNPEPDLFYHAFDSGSTLDLDLNGDGSKDLRFRYNAGYSIATPLRGGGILSDPWGATALQIGDAVGADIGTKVWVGIGTGTLVAFAGSFDPRSPEASGQFKNKDAYLGFQLVEGGQSYYGWIHLSNFDAPGASLYIKEWAYNTTPGQSITVGQVPEPGTIALLVTGGVLLVWRRRK